MNIEINDKLDLMIFLVAKDCGNDDVEMLDSLDTSEVVLDKHFYRKRDRIVAKQKHYPAILILKKGLLRIAVALLIIMSLGFTTVMAIAPLREALFEVVIEWYEDFLTIRYEPTEDGEENASEENDNGITDNTENPPANGPALTPPTIIEVVRKPTYLPEGMIEDVVIQSDAMVCIDYYLNNELVFTFNQLPLSDMEKFIDSKEVVVEEIDIDGLEGFVILYNNKPGLSIVWNDGEYVFQTITSNIGLDEMMTYCKSVK